MADNQPSNLEPIGEEDLNLEKRFDKKTGEGHESVSAHEQKEKTAEKAPEKSVSESDQTYQKILQKVQGQQQASGSDEQVSADAQNMPKEGNRERQIEHLLDIALSKGVPHAVKVARHAEDYYILDQVHDRLLADDLHDELVKKGLIEAE